MPENSKFAKYPDSAIIGLRLRITSNGAKSFCVVRKLDGKFFRVTLGKSPEPSTMVLSTKRQGIPRKTSRMRNRELARSCVC